MLRETPQNAINFIIEQQLSNQKQFMTCTWLTTSNFNMKNGKYLQENKGNKGTNDNCGIQDVPQVTAVRSRVKHDP